MTSVVHDFFIVIEVLSYLVCVILEQEMGLIRVDFPYPLG